MSVHRAFFAACLSVGLTTAAMAEPENFSNDNVRSVSYTPIDDKFGTYRFTVSDDMSVCTKEGRLFSTTYNTEVELVGFAADGDISPIIKLARTLQAESLKTAREEIWWRRLETLDSINDYLTGEKDRLTNEIYNKSISLFVLGDVNITPNGSPKIYAHAKGPLASLKASPTACGSRRVLKA
jgi:hypothetical protein